ncbi:MAG TPA: hypothetical protein VHG09_07070 [Longimicrobiales bacterium]|nr:hypothetical protein [Longimicrobiales bacterium]
MSHLNLETIARLVEDEPDTIEAAHLSSCAECRAQLEAMTEDVHALGLLPDMAAAPDQWEALERRLVHEGLIRRRTHGFGMTARMMQIAAALLLFVGGAWAGRMTAQEPTQPLASTDPAPAETPQVPGTTDVPTAVAADDHVPPQSIDPRSESIDPRSDSVDPRSDSVDPRPAGSVEHAPRERFAPPRRDVTLASNETSAFPQPRTMEEAARLVRATEAMYLEALTGMAEMASNTDAGDPVVRLAALQSILMTTQAALNETPTDPIINGYHLTALAQRDATLRQVAQATGGQWY